MHSIPDDSPTLFPLDDGTPSTFQPMRFHHAPGQLERVARMNGWTPRPQPRPAGTPPQSLSKYKLTSEQFDAMYKAQGGLCALCRKKPDFKIGLHIDHDHKTGRVRGLLCHRCNYGLGWLKDDSEVMRRAVKYLDGTLTFQE